MVGMSEPIRVDQLAGLMAVIDAGAEERGWNQPAFLVRVEPGPGTDELQLGLRNLDLPELRPALVELDELAGQATWECLRSALAHAGRHPQNPIDPELAGWMDDGMFARWMASNVPPYEALLECARVCATPKCWAEIRALLRRWGLRTRAARAA